MHPCIQGSAAWDSSSAKAIPLALWVAEAQSLKSCFPEVGIRLVPELAHPAAPVFLPHHKPMSLASSWRLSPSLGCAFPSCKDSVPVDMESHRDTNSACWELSWRPVVTISEVYCICLCAELVSSPISSKCFHCEAAPEAVQVMRRLLTNNHLN